MRWRKHRRSDNIEDRRANGGGFPFPIGRSGGARRVRSTSIWTILLAIGGMYFFDIDPRLILGLSGSMNAPVQYETPAQSIPPDDEMAQFTATVLAYTEDTWHEIFKQAGERYKEPKLVLFRGSVKSACGFASAAAGPFYCPGDHKVYIDLSFFNEMKRNYGAGGDFAQAYVIAHEVGHHVQTLLGYSQKVTQLQRRSSETKSNELSVRLELQADCLAGLWAHHTQAKYNAIEAGDIEEAIRAAHAIGDDTLQKRHQGHVVPDSFTHGSSEQRIRWFKQGFNNGNFKACDTFSTKAL